MASDAHLRPNDIHLRARLHDSRDGRMSGRRLCLLSWLGLLSRATLRLRLRVRLDLDCLVLLRAGLGRRTFSGSL
jgi:hypothetical protein